MSESSNFPTVMPSLLLDFANAKQLDPRITFTRASTATYYDEDTVALAEQNLLLQSQTFENAYWSKINTSVTANSTAAPDGATTADTLTANGTSSIKGILSSVTSPPSSVGKTFSVFAKADTNNFIQLYFINASEPWANFDLSGGTVGSTGTTVTASIVSFGSGWYRCIVSTTSTSAETPVVSIVSSSSVSRGEINTLSTSVFLWGAQLEQRSAVTAYTVTTTQQITNYIPVLMTAAVGVPRFIFSPTTRESLGLLIEEQRANLLTYSEQFDNAAWTKSNSSITSNTIVAPDGTLTGDKLVENTANAGHILDQSLAVTTGVTYVSSIFAKAGERTSFSFRANNDNSVVTFNLANGTAGAATNGTAFITPLGNNWYRCSLVWTATTTASVVALRIRLLDGSGTSSYTGNGFSGIYIWGAQLEAGAFPTSYIPTVASSVTRSADAANMTGVNFSQWYRADEGTFYCEWSQISISGNNNQWAISITDGTSNNYIGALSNPINYRALVVSGASTQASIINGTLSANVAIKTSFCYKVNDFAATSASASVVTDSSGVIPAVSQANIGSFNGSNFVGGHIRKIAYYPWRLTNAQLQALTS